MINRINYVIIITLYSILNSCIHVSCSPLDKTNPLIGLANFTFVYSANVTGTSDLATKQEVNTKQFTLIISRNKDNLLCICMDGLAIKNGNVNNKSEILRQDKSIAIFDGSDTETFEDLLNNKAPKVIRNHGFNNRAFQDCFAMGKDTATIMDGPDLKAQERYLPFIIKSVNTKTPAKSIWTYNSYKSFHGMTIAGKAICDIIIETSTSQKSSAYRIEYRLTGLSCHSLSKSNFSMVYYSTLDTPVIADGNRYQVLTYDPAAGDLLTQLNDKPRKSLEYKRRMENEAAIRIGDRSNHGNGQNAVTLLSEVEKQSKLTNRNIFIDFYASWCGPCYDLKMYLKDPRIAPIIQKYYIVLSIDVSEQGRSKRWENPGGDRLYTKYGGTDTIPFIAILSPTGKLLANSMYNGKNIGLPSEVEPNDIQQFMNIIRKTASNITGSDLSTLQTVLLHRTKTGR